GTAAPGRTPASGPPRPAKPTASRRKWTPIRSASSAPRETPIPDTLGSAVGAATYARLHLIAVLRGASLALARVYSPVVASGDCGGDGSAQYVSIAPYDAESVGGQAEADR